MARNSGGPSSRKRPRRDAAGSNGEEKSPFYIVATAPAADEHTRVLKQGDTFAVFDHAGDVKRAGLGEEGIYHQGTRFLSGLVLLLGRERPLFLSSTVKEDNDVLAVDLTNADVSRNGAVVVPRGTLHILRGKLLWQAVCYERLHVKNYGMTPVPVSFRLHFDADFADIFEVRGSRRPRRGRSLPPAVEGATVVLAYEGLDGVVRRTRLEFSPPPASLSGSEAAYELTLPPQGEAALYWTVACEPGDERPAVLPYDAAVAEAGRELRRARAGGCLVEAANEEFNAWVNRAAADLHMMTTATEAGPYPYAGVPWFSTPFGRDGLLTALECLWVNPGLCRGVLAYLAATQATEVVPEEDAEPGKILHEARRGEMAALKEIPFGRYYGSVDATPLFVLTAGAYFQRTADHLFLESLWPHVEAALGWIDRYGDVDGDGFVEYARQSSGGLVQQGWKDSHDSVFHADGTLARPPIALCEVQGYVYAAREAAAELAEALGKPERAAALRRQAHELHERFEAAFWCEDVSTYALALDGDKEPCRVRTSNAGHCLFTGIASQERARRTAETLLAEDSFSGWGVRTLSAREKRYNPMSYHNGSVWPHDNALIAQGLARYGFQEAALKILEGMFAASRYVDLHRLPELFCGFARRSGEGPTLYPVACSPQAWSAAAVFMLLRACLGMQIRAGEARVNFSYPMLPDFLPEVRLQNLRVGEASADLLFRRHADDVGLNVLRRRGRLEINLVK